MTIRDQFIEIRQRLVRDGKLPVRVVFSPEGHRKALKENLEGQGFNPRTLNSPPTYMGLPYKILPNMRGDIGLHTEFEEMRGAATLKLGFDASNGQVTVDGRPHGEPLSIMQIVGQHLSAAQLCDIIRAWLDSDDATHWGDFEKTLDRAIVEHGRFE